MNDEIAHRRIVDRGARDSGPGLERFGIARKYANDIQFGRIDELVHRAGLQLTPEDEVEKLLIRRMRMVNRRPSG